ncbi:MAG: head-tail adaptor protein [Muribaculaceae bacterium]|nr:head-tail adaptor protein [Muribaculaceae bacterium]
MLAGKLNERLWLYRKMEVDNPNTGVRSVVWPDEPERSIRAERQKVAYKSVVRGGESFLVADAVYLVRYAHQVRTGDRVRDRSTGELFEVVAEPNRDKDLITLKCTLVND